MDDSYLSISFKVHPISGIEILIAELSLLEFELFEEKPSGLIAYIKSSEYSQNIFEKVKILNSKEFEVEFEGKAQALAMGLAQTSPDGLTIKVTGLSGNRITAEVSQ